jgi:5'(3')-deoxyribonucleotidase
MCKKSPFPRCSSHARKQYETALASGDENLIKKAKISYYTSPEGIKKLREAGKNELADKFQARRKQKIEEALRLDRIQRNVTLALDLDNTSMKFTNAFRNSLAKKYNLSKAEALQKYPEPKDYSFVVSGWFKDHNEFMSEFNEAESKGLYTNMKMLPGARKTIRTLQQKGYTIKVITARTADFNTDTKTALRRYRTPYSTIVHTEEKEKHHADLYFDDSPKQITTLMSHGKKVVAFKASYNNGMKGSARANDWSEIEKIADRLTRSR